jgi:hypothetical protein
LGVGKTLKNCLNNTVGPALGAFYSFSRFWPILANFC